MRKCIAMAIAILVLGSTVVMAAPAKKRSAGKIKNTKIVQATQDTALNYDGVNFFVPKGQTIILGERPNGYIVIRGKDINRLKINKATVSSRGYTVLSYPPDTNLVFLNRGEMLFLTDPNGVTASVGQGGVISADDATINSNTVKELQVAGEQDAKQAAEDLGYDGAGTVAAAAANTTPVAGEDDANEGPSFLYGAPLSNPAKEQAANDVEATLAEEDTLSPSTPR